MKTRKIKVLFAFISLCSFAIAGNTEEFGSVKLPKAKGDDGGKCFDESTRLINVGLGLGSTYFSVLGGYTVSRTPSFSISYEQPWPKRIGPGYLGVGGYLGYQNARYTNNYSSNGNAYYYEHSWNYMMVAGRAMYHWDVLNSGKAEVYGGTIVGVRIQTYNYTTNNTGPNKNDYRYSAGGGIYPTISMVAGARWYFTEKIAVYGEAGSGISYLTAGLTFKL
jgi:hypothetical protein